MTADTLYLLLAALLAVPLCWLLPTALRDDGVAVYTLVVLASLSLITAAWLLLSSALTVLAVARARQSARPGVIYALTGGLLLLGLLVPRELEQWQLVGVAYFTLRNLHVLLDSWMGKSGTPPNLREMMHYQFFLPVIVIGPIHRMPEFLRNLRMRRLDGATLAAGAERALLGFAMASILGSGVMGSGDVRGLSTAAGLHPFLRDWIASALDWVQLYFVFAGLSGFAVGVSLMMGLRIEENFNRPYLSRSLQDFWTRWHISLSLWCRDYVFYPVMAATRSPVLGLLAAMLCIGLWHETSVYYLLWSLWQVIGIILNRVLIGAMASRGLALPGRVAAVAVPVAILVWLSLAKPVIGVLLGYFA